MINTLTKFKNLKESEQLVLAYQGDITDSLTKNLLSLAENKLAMVEYNSRSKKKVFNILVEVLQNIYHNDSDMIKAPEKFRNILIMIVRGDKFYEIISGNYIQSDKVEGLKDRIETINKLDSEALRERYRSRLDEGVFSEKGRAGLGIMDMVRKSGNALDYGFETIDDGFSYFSLQVNIEY